MILKLRILSGLYSTSASAAMPSRVFSRLVLLVILVLLTLSVKELIVVVVEETPNSSGRFCERTVAAAFDLGAQASQEVAVKRQTTEPAKINRPSNVGETIVGYLVFGCCC